MTPNAAGETPALPIIKRPPLAATARRAGWVGCNFDLSRIPADARIEIVRTTTSRRVPRPEARRLFNPQARTPALRSSTPPAEVRAQFQNVKPFANFPVEQRGWMLDVLNVVRQIVESRRRGNESLILNRFLRKSEPANERKR